MEGIELSRGISNYTLWSCRLASLHKTVQIFRYIKFYKKLRTYFISQEPQVNDAKGQVSVFKDNDRTLVIEDTSSKSLLFVERQLHLKYSDLGRIFNHN